MSIVSTSDFKGIHQISQNCYSEGELESYILKYEKVYLQHLLGCELYELVIPEFDPGPPTTPRFVAIFDPFCKDGSLKIHNYYWHRMNHSYHCPVQIISEGIKEMLLGFIYWEYMTNSKFVHHLDGVSVDQSENSREATNAEVGAWTDERYNDAIKTYQAIQWYICHNDDGHEYDEFNGVPKRKIFYGGAF